MEGLFRGTLRRPIKNLGRQRARLVYQVRAGVGVRRSKGRDAPAAPFAQLFSGAGTSALLSRWGGTKPRGLVVRSSCRPQGTFRVRVAQLIAGTVAATLCPSLLLLATASPVMAAGGEGCCYVQGGADNPTGPGATGTNGAAFSGSGGGGAGTTGGKGGDGGSNRASGGNGGTGLRPPVHSEWLEILQVVPAGAAAAAPMASRSDATDYSGDGRLRRQRR